nr:hypothetical protein [Tanacetum cinerariifolium]
ADRPEVTLLPQKRLSIVHCPGYEAREISVAAAARLIEGRRGRQTEIFQRVEALVDDSQYHYETGRLGYMTHTWVQDQRIDAQDTLIATLNIQLSSLQGHLATTLGEIRALQAREQARAGAPEGASSST